MCGRVPRPLDPARPAGPSIDIHFAVVPALARHKAEDAVFFFAGGPGQSAIDLAGALSQRYARFSNRRDLVFVDQRGTGRSAPLSCEDPPPTAPLSELSDPGSQERQMRDCLAKLKALPHGDLRHYTTWVAMQDAEAVRVALGAPQINVVGGSYGTRAVLEYLRQFPKAVRRAVIDGVAPPDMVLPVSFSPDAQSAFDALLGTTITDRERFWELLAAHGPSMLKPGLRAAVHALTFLPVTLPEFRRPFFALDADDLAARGELLALRVTVGRGNEPAARTLMDGLYDAYDAGKATTAEALAGRLSTHYPALQVATGSKDPQGHDVVVNATPLGMNDGDPLPIDMDRLAPTSFVGEVVMKSEMTAFLKAAVARGCAVQVGTDMLFEMIPSYLEYFGFATTTPEQLRALARLQY